MIVVETNMSARQNILLVNGASFLAVAQLAGHNTTLLIFGLVLAIIMMAFFATLIMKLLERFPIISWLGLIVLCYVAGEMLYHGIIEAMAYLNGEPLPTAGGGH